MLNFLTLTCSGFYFFEQMFEFSISSLSDHFCKFTHFKIDQKLKSLPNGLGGRTNTYFY